MKELKQVILLLVLTILLTSCLNSVEKKLVGNYKVQEIELTDSGLRRNMHLSLKINRNKKFTCQKNDTILAGTWNAGDDGDRTWVNLYINNREIQCIVSGQEYEVVEFINAFDLIDERIKKISFIRDK